MGIYNGNVGNSHKALAAPAWWNWRRSCGPVRGPLDKHTLEVMRALMIIASVAFALICSLNIQARAEVVFSEDAYRQLAEANSADTIPVGTKITLQNWQQYKKFMPVQMQAAFSGQYSLHIGSEPMHTMEVGVRTTSRHPVTWRRTPKN